MASTWTILIFFLCLNASLTSGNSEAKTDAANQVRSVSEGSDCRCRCVLRVENGNPCENNPAIRRTLFSVDSASEGRDCRCSCYAPAPPDNCEASVDPGPPQHLESADDGGDGTRVTIPLAEDVLGNKVTVTVTGGSSGTYGALHTVANKTTLEEMLGRALAKINVMKLHSSVTNLMRAMHDLEQALTANYTEEAAVLSKDILKVAATLQKTKNNDETLNEVMNMENFGNLSEHFDNNLTDRPIPAVVSKNTSRNTTQDNFNSTVDLGMKHQLQSNITERESNSDSSVITLGSNETKITRQDEPLKLQVERVNKTGTTVRINLGSQSKLNKTRKKISGRRKLLHVLKSIIIKQNTTLAKPLEKHKSEVYVSNVNHAQSTIIRPVLVAVHRPRKKTAARNRQISPHSAITESQPSVSGNSTIGNTESTQSSNTALPSTASTAITSTAEKEPTTVSVTTTSTVELTTAAATTATAATESSTEPRRTTLATTTPTTLTNIKSKGSSFEFYRNNGDGTSAVDKKRTNDKEYYDDDYYDDADGKNKSAIIHPPLLSNRAATKGDEFDVIRTSERQVTTTTTTVSPTSRLSDDEGYDVKDNYYTNEESDEDYYESYDDLYTTTTTATTTTTMPQTTTLSPDDCGTLLNLSDPRVVHDFGRKEGAWMQDPVAKLESRGKIYVTNFYYGNNLIEFESMHNFKNFRWSNSYMLPYNWIGTGHIVYNGSFYYNRAFSRNLIKYELKYRFVSAWGHLQNAVYDSSTPFTWRGHTMVHMAADESGLWVMYPAYSNFDSHPNAESYVINKLNPTDLRTISSWRTTLHRRSVSHLFIVCGVIYATDRHDERNARITYAYDTHTGVRRALYLPFTNKFSYNVQMLYHHKERKLLSWDDGHQVVYDVNLTH